MINYLILILLMFCLPLQAISGLKLGMSAPLTGPSQALGRELLDGIQPVFTEVNRHGGIHGQAIQLITYDDQYNPDLTLKNTLKLINQDQVDDLFCYVGTPTVAKILPLLRQHKKQRLYFPFTGAQPQRQLPYSQYTLNFRASYYQETAALVDYFVNQNLKRIAVLYQIDAYGRNGWFGTVQALQSHHLSLVSEASYKRGASFNDSFAEQVSLITQGHPDAIIIIGSYQAAAGFIRDIRKSHPTLPIANISFVGAEALIHLLTPIPNATRALYFSHVVPNPLTSQTKAAKHFRSMVARPTFTAFEGYLDATLWVAMKQTPNAKNYDIGLEKPIQFNTTNQAQNTVYLSLYTNGQWLPIMRAQK